MEIHSEENLRVHFVLLDLVPDYPIDDVARELIQAEDFLRTKHRLLVHLL